MITVMHYLMEKNKNSPDRHTEAFRVQGVRVYVGIGQYADQSGIGRICEIDARIGQWQ